MLTEQCAIPICRCGIKNCGLIDHGASLNFHHSWKDFQEQAKRPFKPVKDHVLLPQAVKLDEVDSAFRKILSKESLASVVSLVPDEWLRMIQLKTPEDKRDVYKDFCRKDSQHRLNRKPGPHIFYQFSLRQIFSCLIREIRWNA